MKLCLYSVLTFYKLWTAFTITAYKLIRTQIILFLDYIPQFLQHQSFRWNYFDSLSFSWLHFCGKITPISQITDLKYKPTFIIKSIFIYVYIYIIEDLSLSDHQVVEQ